MKKVILLHLAILLHLTLFSQYKMKHFKEGYVLRNKDTVKCKLYAGKDVDPYMEVVMKYTDNKFEEAIIYHPGSIIKAYGYKSDTGWVEYMVLHKKKSSALSKKYEDAFGKVLAKGRITLVEYTETKYTGVIMQPGGGYNSGTRQITGLFLLRPDKDTASDINTTGLFRGGIDEEELKHVFSDYPELVTRIKKKTKLEDLVGYIREYNTWYMKNKKGSE